jgi:hypothetical protein
MAARGMDRDYGHRLYERLRAHGLVGIGAEGRAIAGAGGSPLAAFLRLSFAQLREALVDVGGATAEDLAGVQALHAAPDFVFVGPMLVAAWDGERNRRVERERRGAPPSRRRTPSGVAAVRDGRASARCAA